MLAQLGIKDGEVVLSFFVFFSRFEYALKRSNYVVKRPDPKPHRVEVNWKCFAKDLEPLFDPAKYAELARAVSYLEEKPPRKQVIIKDEIRFIPAEGLEEKSQSERLVDLIRIIRNNLFHGGKYPNGPEEELARDTLLLCSSLVVLKEFLNLNEQVRQYFIEVV